jgi:hypothetical protein
VCCRVCCRACARPRLSPPMGRQGGGSAQSFWNGVDGEPQHREAATSGDRVIRERWSRGAATVSERSSVGSASAASCVWLLLRRGTSLCWARSRAAGVTVGRRACDRVGRCDAMRGAISGFRDAFLPTLGRSSGGRVRREATSEGLGQALKRQRCACSCVNNGQADTKSYHARIGCMMCRVLSVGVDLLLFLLIPLSLMHLSQCCVALGS